MLKLRSIYLPSLFKAAPSGQHTLAQKDEDQTCWKIGRSPECELSLDDAKISGVHAKIQFIDNSFYFFDVGSSNGSVINGEKVDSNVLHRLAVGDEIEIGETRLHLDKIILLPSSVKSSSINVSWWIDQDIDLHCTDILDETSDVKTFSFVADPRVLFNYRPGQFARLEFQIDNERIVRPYTISSSPTRPDVLQFTVKRGVRPEGSNDISVSNWLHDRFQVGDSIRILGGPKGSFTPAPQFPAKLLLVSAGSGITPMMSIARYLSDHRSTVDVVFFHSARTIADCIFRSELELLTQQNRRLSLRIALTRPQPGTGWFGLTGHLDAAMLQMIAPDARDRSVFVCGSDGFMQHVKQLFSDIEFPMAQYHEESFGEAEALLGDPNETEQNEPIPVLEPQLLMEDAETKSAQSAETIPPAPELPSAPLLESPANSSSTAPTIRFKRLNKSTEVDAETKILEAAEQVGANIETNGCWAGRCGTCKVRVCGTIEYRKGQPSPVLTQADKEKGYVLSCIAYPVGMVEVDA